MTLLVVDANVARSASNQEGAGHPSPACSAVLHAIYRSEGCEAGFRVAMSATLLWEWERHGTPFSTSWLANMLTVGRVEVLDDDEVEAVAAVMAAQRGRFAQRRAAVAKDGHVLGLAVRAGRVVNRDKKLRADVKRALPSVPTLASIAWVNPEDQEGAEGWLAAGAPRVVPWVLGR